MPGGARDTGQLPRSGQLDIDADAIFPAMTFRGHEMDALSDRSRCRVRPMPSGRATLKTPSEVKSEYSAVFVGYAPDTIRPPSNDVL